MMGPIVLTVAAFAGLTLALAAAHYSRRWWGALYQDEDR